MVGVEWGGQTPTSVAPPVVREANFSSLPFRCILEMILTDFAESWGTRLYLTDVGWMLVGWPARPSGRQRTNTHTQHTHTQVTD